MNADGPPGKTGGRAGGFPGNGGNSPETGRARGQQELQRMGGGDAGGQGIGPGYALLGAQGRKTFHVQSGVFRMRGGMALRQFDGLAEEAAPDEQRQGGTPRLLEGRSGEVSNLHKSAGRPVGIASHEQLFGAASGAHAQTGAGRGLGNGNALRYVQQKYGVNHMACVCAIDRATLPPLANYWAPGVTVSGLHELVANALVMKGECKRTMDLRQEDLPNVEPDETETQVEGQ